MQKSCTPSFCHTRGIMTGCFRVRTRCLKTLECLSQLFQGQSKNWKCKSGLRYKEGDKAKRTFISSNTALKTENEADIRIRISRYAPMDYKGCTRENQNEAILALSNNTKKIKNTQEKILRGVGH